LKNRKRHLVLVTHDGAEDKTDYEHTVLKVKLQHNDERYILDLTGAQYGFFEPIVPASQYETLNVKTYITTFGGDDFGETKKTVVTWSKYKGVVGSSIELNAMISKCLMKGAEAWEKEHSMTISMLLRLKDDEFEERREGLITKIDLWVNDCVEVMKE
jgi:hypothetical protein